MLGFFKKIFRKASVITITNVYLLILAGGIVRCTGSGMGCPDWPKCFGRWIPPTEISELPSNYKELYSKGGHLTVEFNVLKTWTEYLNRLLGVLAGFAIFITLIASIGFWKSNRIIFYCSLAAFILVGFQGWLGAKVVASNLKPIIISIHMLLALVIVALLLKALSFSSVLQKGISKNLDIYFKNPILDFHGGEGTDGIEVYRDTQKNKSNIKFLKWVSLLVCIISLIQILIGTQVRQAIDVLALQGNYRSDWISGLGFVFDLHVFLAYLVVFCTGFLIYHLFKLRLNRFVAWTLLLCIIAEYLGGVFMYRFAIPAFMQPIHLTCASILFGISFYMFALLDE